MSYADMLAGTTRTYAPVVSCGTIKGNHDGRRLAEARHRTDDDSHDFREMRALMHQTHSMAG